MIPGVGLDAAAFNRQRATDEVTAGKAHVADAEVSVGSIHQVPRSTENPAVASSILTSASPSALSVITKGLPVTLKCPPQSCQHRAACAQARRRPTGVAWTRAMQA